MTHVFVNGRLACTFYGGSHNNDEHLNDAIGYIVQLQSWWRSKDKPKLKCATVTFVGDAAIREEW